MDCVSVLPGSRLASKSADGRVIVWDLSSGDKTQLTAWKVPGCAAGDGARGRFGTTADGDVLVVGSAAGDAFAYDTTNGAKMATFSTGKVCAAHVFARFCRPCVHVSISCQVRAPVQACAVTNDCRNVLAVFGTGLIARWELITAGNAAAAADAADDA